MKRATSAADHARLMADSVAITAVRCVEALPPPLGICASLVALDGGGDLARRTGWSASMWDGLSVFFLGFGVAGPDFCVNLTIFW